MQGGSDEQLNRQATVIGDTLRAWWFVYWRSRHKKERKRRPVRSKEKRPLAQQMTGRRVRHEQTRISDAHLFAFLHSAASHVGRNILQTYCMDVKWWGDALFGRAVCKHCRVPSPTSVVISSLPPSPSSKNSRRIQEKKEKLSKTVVDNSNSKSLFAFAWIEMQHHRTVGHAKSASKGIISLQID